MADAGALRGPVLIVGAGLLGTSLGLALSRPGIPVWLRDVSPENLRHRYGPGCRPARPGHRPAPQLVVVAVPPDVHRRVAALGADHHREAVVTDVGSIKTGPLEQLRAHSPPGWPATSAATRWPAASAPGRWRPVPPSSTAVPGRSRPTRTPPPRRSIW